jgi:tetratricopeptide (TPR) repeat protein
VGEVLYNRGLNDEALHALKRSIDLAPDNPDAHYLLGFVLGDMGRHDEAQKATKRAIQLNPALSRAHANLSLDRSTPHTYEASSPNARRARWIARWPSRRKDSSRTSTSVSRSAEGLLRRSASRIPPRGRPRRGRGAGAAGDGRGAPAQEGAGDGRAAVRQAARDASGQPEALE